jgi:hypothetical protein
VTGQFASSRDGRKFERNFILPGRASAQVVEKRMVGDTGFEPVTSTVCKKHGPKKEPGK